ncbi:MAG: hypothetical protein JW936_09275 [Sedimentisphaerales bacterium]|nr:hypothetical protein [Sedimentisphaerales bacterium]
MKRLVILMWLVSGCLAGFNGFCAGQIIVDHECTNITEIPEWAINQAKDRLHIAYGHTSHGSQLIDGMDGLVDFANEGGLGLLLEEDIFAFNYGGEYGALDLRDTPFEGADDLGSPDRRAWARATRRYLDDPDNADVNVIVWSWCGQAATDTSEIDIYLDLMEDLIEDYPDVQFVFMTGHLDGSGLDGDLNRANEHIRQHCRENERILYDFADIESYDPDGRHNYMRWYCDDACNYDRDGDGDYDGNWARDWQESHHQGEHWYDCGSAHSEPLNANRKAYAAWWLWARLAGWEGSEASSDSGAGRWDGAKRSVR